MTHPYLKVKSTLPKNCQIIAVSKLQPSEKIIEVYKLGQRHFAENYVQEAVKKISDVNKEDICWHFIGSLQKNKVKDVVGRFEFIHSIDNLALAETIQKYAQKLNLTQKIFIQVNLSLEKTKGGVYKEDLSHLIEAISKLQNIKIVGLMTMPPLNIDTENTRIFFQKLKKLQIVLNKKFPDLTELSMGTSSDYLVAAEEGATFVRLGTILFGDRK